MARNLWRLVWRMVRLFQKGKDLPFGLEWLAIYDGWCSVYEEYMEAGGDPGLLFTYGASEGGLTHD